MSEQVHRMKVELKPLVHLGRGKQENNMLSNSGRARARKCQSGHNNTETQYTDTCTPTQWELGHSDPLLRMHWPNKSCIAHTPPCAQTENWWMRPTSRKCDRRLQKKKKSDVLNTGNLQQGITVYSVHSNMSSVWWVNATVEDSHKMGPECLSSWPASGLGWWACGWIFTSSVVISTKSS